MWTLIFGQMVVQKERIYKRGPQILVEWSYPNKINKSMRNIMFVGDCQRLSLINGIVDSLLHNLSFRNWM